MTSSKTMDVNRRALLTGVGGTAALLAIASGSEASAEAGERTGTKIAEATSVAGIADTLKSLGAVNVRLFGATGNGRRDDTRAFRRAFRALNRTGGIIFVPPGTYRVGELEAPPGTSWIGVPGKSVLKHNRRDFLLAVSKASQVRFQDLVFDGNKRARLDEDALVIVRKGSKQVRFEGCTFQNSSTSCLAIEDSACTVTDCLVHRARWYGIIVNSRDEVRITGNKIVDLDNKGIYVLRDQPQSVHTVIAENVISRIKAREGGTGQYGNGVNVYNAHDVLVQGNHITECEFSAFRSAGGNGCRVIGNHFEKCRETTVYVEFGASRAVISSNHFIDCPDRAISITNFDDGGHVAICSSNIITRTGREAIFAEADTIIQGNIIDGAVNGIVVGDGEYARNVTVDGNLIQDTRKGSKRRLRYGILVTANEDAGPAFITNNRVFNARYKTIYGHESRKPSPMGSNVFLSHNYPGVPSKDVPKRALGGSVNYEPDTGIQRSFQGKRWSGA